MEVEQIKSSFENGTYTTDDIRTVIQWLDEGKIRVAEKIDGSWHVNQWIKQAIMAYFGVQKNEEIKIGEFFFRDKLPLKQNFGNVRIVPGGNAIRYGSFLADQVIMMPPSYVNIGAYVGSGSMIDSNALVGSCAQIGAHVHLSAGVQIGGVLEPLNAQPVIIADGAFIGAGAIIVEGIWVKENAVIAPGVVLTASTKIIETDAQGAIVRSFYGHIPAHAIVLPGARMRGEVMIQTPVIVGYKDEKTNAKIALSQFLREF